MTVRCLEMRIWIGAKDFHVGRAIERKIMEGLRRKRDDH
jgi:hypothetical protein